MSRAELDIPQTPAEVLYQVSKVMLLLSNNSIHSNDFDTNHENLKNIKANIIGFYLGCS